MAWRGSKPLPLTERITRLSIPEPNSGCWLWLGVINNWGYGNISARRGDGSPTTAPAHRVSYEAFVGPIPDGLQIDHVCANRSCVSPSHLEAVTQRENILRSNNMGARHARKTHCLRGHPLSGDNLRIYVMGGQRNRWCVACHRLREQAKKAAAS